MPQTHNIQPHDIQEGNASFFNANLSVANILRRLNTHGITVTCSHDFHEYYRIFQEHRGSTPTPMFDLSHTILESENAFWIMGMKDGNVVHLQAAQIYNIKGRNMAQFLKDMVLRYYQRRYPDAKLSANSLTHPFLKTISGKIAYSGDFWLKPKIHQHYQSDMILDMSHLIMAFIWQNWQPDYAFGYASMRHTDRGLMGRYGFTHILSDAICWDIRPDDDPSRQSVGFISREEMEYRFWLMGHHYLNESIRDDTKVPVVHSKAS